ncbi:MAG: response regulator [Verrucomicrobium sp.]|jgi:two-component system cell cycle response regulator|nr:response regulator [Verrucomicrobium sp.]
MKPKILTVDDSKTIRMVVAKALKPFDVDVLEASNGVEGVAVAMRERPDLILLDLTMPIMDGSECLAKLKSHADLKNTPVIMLTQESGRDNITKISRMGVRDYLVKPFKEDMLIERAGRIIELKAKGGGVKKVKRYDDPLNILVVDDKPAILEQIKAAVSDTPWQVHGRTQTGEALDYCSQNVPDCILVSLSLPDGAGFTLFQMFRASTRTKSAPIFGLSVKTATDDQTRAQQVGFLGVITKPLDPEDLKMKICRSLNLDTSYKYFQQRDGTLSVVLPQNLSANVATEIALQMRNKVSEAVDSGLGKMIIDMSQVRTPDINLVKLGITTIQLCNELSLQHRLVGSTIVQAECRNYEETKDWVFVASFEDAMRELNRK